MAVVIRASNTVDAQAARQTRLAPIVQEMHSMVDTAAEDSERGRLRMRRAVEAMRRKRVA